MAEAPKTKYAKSGDVHIAYQVHGEGDIDLVQVPGFASHLDASWQNPFYVAAQEQLGSFARCIRFDKRGTGLSDPVTDMPTLEVRMDDVRAVMDEVGSERAALFGVSEGGAMACLFAATYPEKVASLILWGAMAKGMASEDYPWAPDPAVFSDEALEMLRGGWGEGHSAEIFAPSVAESPGVREASAQYERLSASPGALVALNKMYSEIDIREVLPSIQTPTLIIHRTGDRAVNVRNARYLADNIPKARLLEMEGIDHHPFLNSDQWLDEVEEFLTGSTPAPVPDRVLSTVVFTDIVDSTKKAAELGDSKWKQVLEKQGELTLEELEKFRGRAVKSTGDGFLATFDGPARGVRCAQSISKAVRQLGIEVRAGCHTGECELLGDDIGGIAVHIAARISAMAGAGEVLVSRTVKDLVVGSGIEFDDKGTHELKGVPDRWHVFAAN